MNEKHTNTESKRHKKQPKIKNKTHTNIQSSTPTIKSNNPHRKKTKKPEKETLYYKLTTPDRPPPAAVMLRGANNE